MPLHGLAAVKKAIRKNKKEANELIKAVYLDGLGQIVSGTPADKGRARNNWFLTVGQPFGLESSGRTTNKTGAWSMMSIGTMPKNVLNKKIYFTNNLPYIETLEYGGFPNPVKQGSYIKRSKSFEKLSSGGFSKQAPSGWVRSTLILMQNKIRSS